jgi:hypothetical protein
MCYGLAFLAAGVVAAGPALALDLPARKPGLWEVKMTFVGRNLPQQSIRECLDAATDKLMNANFSGAAAGVTCSKQDMTRSGATLTIDSVCAVNGAVVSSHSVVAGSFDSAYTVDVTSKREGGPPLPGAAPGASHETHMSIAAKWLGPCEPGQRPGDMVMSNGITMNILDLQAKRPPQRP